MLTDRVQRQDCRLSVPRGGFWREALDSDATPYGGSGVGDFGGVEAAAVPAHGRSHSIAATLPPLAVVFFVNDG